VSQLTGLPDIPERAPIFDAAEMLLERSHGIAR